MSDTTASILLNTDRITIIQHNCRKSKEAMSSCLESNRNTAHIILLQEPWIGPDNITIAHPSFIKVIPNTEQKPRVMAFINQLSKHFTCTSRPDILNDLDLQILSLSTERERILLLNCYNEKATAEDLET